MPTIEVEFGGQNYNVNVPDGVDIPTYLKQYRDNMQGRVDTSDLVPSARVAGKMALQAQPVLGSLVPNDPEMAAYYSKHPTAANIYKGVASLPAWAGLMAVAPQLGFGRAATLGLQALTGGATTAADIEARNATGQADRPDGLSYATQVGLGTAAPYVGNALGKVFSPGSKWAQAELDAADPMRVLREQLAKGPQGTKIDPNLILPTNVAAETAATGRPTIIKDFKPAPPANVNVIESALAGKSPPFVNPQYESLFYKGGKALPPANNNNPFANAVTQADLDAIGRAVPAAERGVPAAVSPTGKPVFTGQGAMDWMTGMGKAAGAGIIVDAASHLGGQMLPMGAVTTAAILGKALGPPIAKGAAQVGNFLVSQPPVQKYLANSLFSQPGTLINNTMLAAPEAMYQNYNEQGGSPVFTSPVTGR